MSITHCPSCCQEVRWSWTEAFDKFGFEDGDGLVMTEHVAGTLTIAGYTVETSIWSIHNVIITSIKRDDIELIPEKANLGYDDPLEYLPDDIIAVLNDAYPDNRVVEVPL
jgi:hypothetical protein